MGEGVSLYLDLIRLGAALLVCLHHFSARTEFSGNFLWQFRGLARPAVIVFFVLSGLVIAYVAQRPGYGVGPFAADRIARILSVAVPAVLLTFVLDAIGERSRPDLYEPVLDRGHSALVQALAALSFINQSRFGPIGVGSNTPYWSLPYEVWYYVVFGLAVYARGWWRWLAPVLALAVAGPAIAALAPVWLLGCVTCWLAPRLRMPPLLGLAIVVATVTGGIGAGMALNLAHADQGEPAAATGSVMPWAVAVGVAVNFVAAWQAERPLLRLLGPAARPIRVLARMTFTLYLVHLPLMFMLRAISPWPSASWRDRALVLGGALAGAAALTVVTDHLHTALRRTLRAVFSPRATATARIAELRGEGQPPSYWTRMTTNQG